MTDIIKYLKKQNDFYYLSRVDDYFIKQAEEKLSLLFSKEYSIVVKEFGTVSVNCHELTGICKDNRLNVVDVTLKERERNPDISKDWYVIEQLHIDGIVIWQSSTGEIYQTLPGAKPEKICDSLAEYIQLD